MKIAIIGFLVLLVLFGTSLFSLPRIVLSGVTGQRLTADECILHPSCSVQLVAILEDPDNPSLAIQARKRLVVLQNTGWDCKQEMLLDYSSMDMGTHTLHSCIK